MNVAKVWEPLVLWWVVFITVWISHSPLGFEHFAVSLLALQLGDVCNFMP